MREIALGLLASVLAINRERENARSNSSLCISICCLALSVKCGDANT